MQQQINEWQGTGAQGSAFPQSLKGASIPGDTRTGSGAGQGNPSRSIAGLVHDARNMVAAMDLYCELLAEPGVLAPLFHHYASELRMVSGASRRLLDELAIVESATRLYGQADLREILYRLSDRRATPRPPKQSRPQSSEQEGFDRYSETAGSSPVSLTRQGRRSFQPGKWVENLAEELLANQNLLDALVGPAVTLGVSVLGGQKSIAMACDDLTRVLVNLARNAAEAMPAGGHIQIALEEGPDYLAITCADNGPGIPEEALETIFSPGFSTHVVLDRDSDGGSCEWPVQHRGLGLSIVRSLINAAGGSVWAANRKLEPGGSHEISGVSQSNLNARGAIFTVEFPLPEAASAP